MMRDRKSVLSGKNERMMNAPGTGTQCDENASLQGNGNAGDLVRSINTQPTKNNQVKTSEGQYT